MTVALSWIPDILRELTVTLVVLSTVGSRWRFMVYMCVVTCSQAFLSAVTLLVTNLTTTSSDLTATEDSSGGTSSCQVRRVETEIVSDLNKCAAESYASSTAQTVSHVFNGSQM